MVADAVLNVSYGTRIDIIKVCQTNKSFRNFGTQLPNYKNRPNCPLCSKAGHGDAAHFSGSGRCAVNRIALKECRKQDSRHATTTDSEIPLILCEPYRVRRTQDWITNETETAAIWVRAAARARTAARGVRDDYVWARVGAVTCVSVYLTPNCAAAEFVAKVALLEDGLRDLPGDLMVAGDFNARAIEWGMTETNRRGRLLLEMAARLDLVVANTGNVPTYRRPGFGDSIPDVTMTTDRILPRVGRWRVFEGYTASDHQYIVFEVAEETTTTRTGIQHPPRWNVDKLDAHKLSVELAKAPAPITDVPPELTGRQRAERLADETTKLTTRLCNSTMPKRRYGRNRQPQYWWTDGIAELRKSCLVKRRRVTRAGENRKGNPPGRVQDGTETTDGRHQGQLGARIPPELKDAETARRIIDGLFPTHPTRTDATNGDETAPSPVFTAEELVGAARAMKMGKAPGPDGVPAEVLWLMGLSATGERRQSWSLSLRGKGDPSAPSAYRPLSLLDTTGKLFEQLLRPRLTDAIQKGGGLSDRQFGFRRGRSTIGAIQEVVDSFRETGRHCHAARPIVLLATLDVRNTFNSARWVDILESLRGDFGVPPYLLRVVEDYLWNRRLTYGTTEGQVTRQITAGVAQGSILGPDFWNGIYDSLLRLELPLGVRLVTYADDVAAVIVERTPDLAQYVINQTMRRVGRWMTDHGLQLATEKTELVLFTRRRIPTTLRMTVGTDKIETRGEVKYLGVTLDTKMTFWPHIQRTAQRAAERIASPSRLRANTNGPRPGKRGL
ncbi:uncharacterized protein LOC124416204 [Diprion similis]|uniref:uncharacterized protein LOC124416204 n=1 Tax=Diprion similis TaxID=362088 RepID=UPI001EF84E08|nr:uncharacterized protein LOC124416204 [Diprion similis]